jgi:polyhydroxyalkanoate synthase
LSVLTDTEVTFCLSSGGHNAGIVNPPLNDSAQSYQITNRAADAAYVDAQTWKISAPVCRGSWGGCRQRHCQGHRLMSGRTAGEQTCNASCQLDLF